ncbi:polysaccharide pyruvyl transferase family protein [Knoellia sp. CPCC 206435]|uniref:polysaccharide pyruvyl transferase family protein n=1 Tax=Knoellia terrae TaxID=3404797 RepID=UPI003B4344F3
MNTRRHPIGLVGAYERDNFGDILFLERTNAYLAAHSLPSVALAPFKDSRELLEGGHTSRSADALRDGSISALWTVGGEVGAVPLYAAYRMLDPDVQAENFSVSRRTVRRRMIREASGLALTDLAYLPRLSAFPNSWGTPSILNSVGLSGVANLKGEVRAKAEAAIRDADYISVRERQSAAFLSSVGVAHQLAPDLVHTLRIDRPDLATDDVRTDARTAGSVLVQMSAAALATQGVGRLAKALVDCPALSGKDVRLFVAGLAPGHDSLSAYCDVMGIVKRSRARFDISMSDSVTAIEKVEEIARASLVIGTSLHAMIVSMTFDVPHVGLLLEKVTRYATAWADPMPTNVSLLDLNEAVSHALSLECEVSNSGLANSWAEAAHRSIERAIDVVEVGSAAREVALRQERRSSNDVAFQRVVRSPKSLALRMARSALRPLA